MSAASGSSPALTVPRTVGSASVNGAKAIEADALAPMLASIVSIVRPSISRVTGTFGAAAALRFITPALTVIRSWPENSARPNVTDGIDTLTGSGWATDTGVSVMFSPNLMSSAPVQPDFWKSEIRTASRRGSVDCDRMLSASFSAGP